MLDLFGKSLLDTALAIGKDILKTRIDNWNQSYLEKKRRDAKRRLSELSPEIIDAITLNSDETANGSIHLEVPEAYGHHRSVLDRSGRSAQSLWVSSRTARPMSYLGIEATITRTTELTTGMAVSPHLFRTSAATTAAIHAGNTPHLASALLDHRDTVTTQRHYNRATSLTAGKTYLNVIRSEYG
jgi:integrase